MIGVLHPNESRILARANPFLNYGHNADIESFRIVNENKARQCDAINVPFSTCRCNPGTAGGRVRAAFVQHFPCDW